MQNPQTTNRDALRDQELAAVKAELAAIKEALAHVKAGYDISPVKGEMRLGQLLANFA